MATGRIVDLWHRKDRTRTTRYGTGKRWQAIWTDDRGEREKKSFDYKDGAQAWLDTKTVDNTLTPGGLKTPILFEKYYKIWLEKQAHQRPNSMRTLTNHCKNWVVPSFEGKYLHQVEQRDIQRAIYRWQESNALSTTELMYRYTRQIFSEAVHDKYIRESPCQRIKFREAEFEDDEPEFMLSEQVFLNLHKELREPYKTAALVASSTGLRPRELIGLVVKDIDFPSATIRLTMQDASTSTTNIKRGPLKTKHSRRKVSFGPELRDVLKKLCQDAGADGRLFHVSGAPALYWRFEFEWSRVREILPEIGSGWHQLRHYHASLLIAGGMSPVAVAARLGHKDATVTLQVYAHLWVDDVSSMATIGDSVVRKATQRPQAA